MPCYWGCCHIRPILTASLLQITHQHMTCRHTQRDTNVAWWCIFHVFHGTSFFVWCVWVKPPHALNPCELLWIKCGGRTMVLYWSCLAESPQRKKKRRSRKQTRIHTHGLPSVMAVGSLATIFLSKWGKTHKIIDWGRSREQRSHCLGSWSKPMVIILSSPEPQFLYCKIGRVVHGSQMVRSFKSAGVHQL